MRYINFPVAAPADAYDSAIQKMCVLLSGRKEVVSIYQIGGVSAPGISDLDMVVVFRKDAHFGKNPVQELAQHEKYFFIHSLYGIPDSLFDEAMRYTFFHNYKLLHGKEMRKEVIPLPADELRLLKAQVALEFLLKMFITLSLQRVYKIVKIRSLLLHCKGLLYDLDFLDIRSGRLHDLIKEMIVKREQWFTDSFNPVYFDRWMEACHHELYLFLSDSFEKKTFYLPGNEPLHVARNIIIKRGNAFRFRHRGIPLPPALASMNRKMINLQNRFNRFECIIPVKDEKLPAVIAQQFRLTEKMKSYNMHYLPYFYPLTSSLNT